MKTTWLMLFLFLTTPLLAQEKQQVTAADYANREVSMADSFRAEGKIYVVVAILATVLAGLLVFTLVTDRKVSKLEQEMEHLKKKIIN